jgi:hypothetical protein
VVPDAAAIVSGSALKPHASGHTKTAAPSGWTASVLRDREVEPGAPTRQPFELPRGVDAGEAAAEDQDPGPGDVMRRWMARGPPPCRWRSMPLSLRDTSVEPGAVRDKIAGTGPDDSQNWASIRRRDRGSDCESADPSLPSPVRTPTVACRGGVD